ncbi:MAG: 2-amino-4-hydroxy-6-hydroxymethyldihydropteridine diphosphokinase [Verrucomicrobiae bacterium]|nr:2-amino-4-hydroxy-6-hydroxymethyldihydropteridine diphosphokinase [Verrucomicrobiae bacterium]
MEHLKAGIALGSNVGNRLDHLRQARERLRPLHEGAAEDFLISPIFETEPVGCAPGTAAFLNAVVELETDRPPLDLLNATQTIEHALGRPDLRPKNSPRSIDIDLLYIGDHRVNTDRLILPHPRLLERRFVLEPLAVISGDRDFGFGPVSALLAKLKSEEAPPVLWKEDW